MGAEDKERLETAEFLVEIYTPERKAEFLLQTAVGKEDYERAREEVRKLGVNPDSIPHDRPA